ncbi:MAG: hypothetical protein JNM41_13090 [Flavipsychrobacter sp.]|nr:hypothetical protein [Flavipsychrobacter sp.]
MQIRNILLTALLTVALFSAISYTACKKDACENVICLNLGACVGGECVCPTGFEGSRCEKLSRDRFIKTYNGYDTCNYTTLDSTRIDVYPIYFRALQNDPRSMMMKNILNDMADSALCTMQGTDTFSFQGSNNTLTYVGGGKMRNDSLWLVYRVERDTTGYVCTFFGQGLR